MSNVIARSLIVNGTNATSYFTKTDSKMDIGYNKEAFHVTGTQNTVWARANQSAMDVLYPNATAHPIRGDAQITLRRTYYIISQTGRAYWNINNTRIAEASTSKNNTYEAITTTDIRSSALTGSSKVSQIDFGCYISASLCETFVRDCYLTLYFNRYDFSASAGDSIASASVSSSTGYDGDSITYSCVLQSGATFDGWYDGSTRVSTSQSYTITVAGADKALEARATGGQIIRKRYMVCGSEVKMGDDTTERFSLTYGDSTLISDLDGAKTLLCKDKVMSGNVHIGTRYAGCSGKIMLYHLVAMLCQGEWLMNTALNGGTSGTMSASGWCVTPYLPVPAGCTSITIEAGGTQSGSVLHEYDAGLGYLSYWGGGTNPRTFNFDYPAQIKFVRATFNIANLAGCYIRDNTHGGYIYRGGAV